MRSLDPPSEFAAFLADYRREYRTRWLHHEARFLYRNGQHFDAVQIAGSAASSLAYMEGPRKRVPRPLGLS
jgi:hypothetical protein